MKLPAQPSKDTAAKILQAAKKLFARTGYDGVSIKKISLEAGTNSALISYYFGGKPQLYQAVLNQQADIIISTIEKLKDSQLPHLNNILMFMDEQTRLHLKDPDSMQVIYREFLTPTHEGSDIINQRMFGIFDRLTEAFEAARSQNAIKADVDCRRAAFTLISIFAFYLLTYKYEALTEEKRLPGSDDFRRLQGVYLDYLKSLSATKGDCHELI